MASGVLKHLCACSPLQDAADEGLDSKEVYACRAETSGGPATESSCSVSQPGASAQQAQRSSRQPQAPGPSSPAAGLGGCNCLMAYHPLRRKIIQAAICGVQPLTAQSHPRADLPLLA